MSIPPVAGQQPKMPLPLKETSSQQSQAENSEGSSSLPQPTHTREALLNAPRTFHSTLLHLDFNELLKLFEEQPDRQGDIEIYLTQQWHTMVTEATNEALPLQDVIRSIDRLKGGSLMKFQRLLKELGNLKMTTIFTPSTTPPIIDKNFLLPSYLKQLQQASKDQATFALWEKLCKTYSEKSQSLLPPNYRNYTVAQIRDWMEAHKAQLAEQESLDLDHLSSTTIPLELIKYFTGLKTLNLSNNDTFCRLPEDLLSHFPKLTHLNLSSNGFRTLPKFLLNEARNLTHLDLSNNQFQTLPPGCFKPLSSLTHLNLSQIKSWLSFPQEAFQEGLDNLTSLVMAGSNLSELPPQAFSNSPNLTHLDLSCNAFTKLYSLAFRGLKNLTHLKLINTFSASMTLPQELFNGLDNLTHLDLAFNFHSLTFTDATFSPLCSLTHLNLKNTQFKTSSSYGLRILSEGLLSNLKFLKELNLSQCELISISRKAFDHCTHLTHLNLESNNLTELDPDVFDQLPYLDYLHLGANLLTGLPVGIFKNQGRLTVLHLNANKFETLPPGIFDPLNELRKREQLRRRFCPDDDVVGFHS